MSIDRCIYGVLEIGADDWIYLAEVTCVAKWIGGANTESANRQLTAEIIRAVVETRLMEVGDLGSENGRFQRWNCSVAEAMHRIHREWIALGTSPSLGDICWLSNTPSGDRIGKSLLHLWNSSRDVPDRLLMRSSIMGRVDLDWVLSLVELERQLAGLERNPTIIQNAAHTLVSNLLEQCLMKVGALVGGQFHCWSVSAEEVSERIAMELAAIDVGISAGVEVWLQNTARGERRAAQLLEDWTERL